MLAQAFLRARPGIARKVEPIPEAVESGCALLDPIQVQKGVAIWATALYLLAGGDLIAARAKA